MKKLKRCEMKAEQALRMVIFQSPILRKNITSADSIWPCNYDATEIECICQVVDTFDFEKGGQKNSSDEKNNEKIRRAT